VELLYNEQKKRTDIYTFDINQGGAFDVTIYFVNGKFNKAHHNIGDGFKYTKSYYAVMGAISEKIDALELRYKRDGSDK